MRVDALYPAQLSRPDLPIPYAPSSMGTPRYAMVGRRIRLAAIWAAAGVLVGEFLGGSAWPYVVAFVAAVVAYALVSAVLLAMSRRRQASFEPAWLAAQSEVLQGRQFEVLRFMTNEPEDTEHGRRTKRRVYDLAQPSEVAKLFELRSRAVADGVNVPVTVEFSYPTEDAAKMGVERVRSELASIPMVGRRGAEITPRVWFPDGRYLVQPATERPVTYWVLGQPSLIVAEPAQDLTPVSAET
ncbi:hypothetical protein JOF56_007102 [Kibdelosporangium banguiense]|uniref:Uncharacterized protein n=1 Tax=Kibdelosporangium banguiense TaxID=1365924 RepID=A0ABS4TQN4_9PSEU|nr:hypothetical protein [Kibdelosporangium banguiense]MBP2326717.1 hypothetical protein [Kibdelosporangium banguiense]